MQEVIMVKDESAGFAYSSHEKVIKLKIRPARDGWFLEERGGTKGGTLTERPTITVKDEAAAIELLNTKVGEAIADGYKLAGPAPTTELQMSPSPSM